MAGGVGSRFWPLSRNAKPKQFLDILGIGKTLLQQTFDRFTKVCPPQNIIVVTNESYVKQVQEQLPQLKADQILSEPHRKNTAPCCAFASYKIMAHNADANIIVAPSDHIIKNEKAFTDVLLSGLKFTAANDALLTIGIKPNRPDTGYGYIQFIDDKKKTKNKISKVKTFTEKPDLEMAKFFLQSGEFLWNAGIFLWSAKSITKALAQYLPEVNDLFEAGMSHYYTDKENAFIKKAYAICPNISIDYGVMEKANNVHVISADIGWSDLGTYGSLYEHMHHDENKNAIVGKNVMAYETKNCVIQMPNNKLVVLQGLDDYIVVESDNVLLVCKKDSEQQIRQFVSDVKINKGESFI